VDCARSRDDGHFANQYLGAPALGRGLGDDRGDDSQEFLLTRRVPGSLLRRPARLLDELVPVVHVQPADSLLGDEVEHQRQPALAAQAEVLRVVQGHAHPLPRGPNLDLLKRRLVPQPAEVRPPGLDDLITLVVDGPGEL
jgi:hypothetical protein